MSKSRRSEYADAMAGLVLGVSAFATGLVLDDQAGSDGTGQILASCLGVALVVGVGLTYTLKRSLLLTGSIVGTFLGLIVLTLIYVARTQN